LPAAADRGDEARYGLSVGADHRVRYNGPLKQVGLDGDRVGDLLGPLLRRAPIPHVVILPQAGLVILATSHTDFLGFQFASPISRNHLARFLGTLCVNKKARLIDEYDAIEVT
jgi:hypothetical protein